MPLPMVVEAKSGADLTEYLAEHREALEEQLPRAGAILFRGFDVVGPEGLERVVSAAPGEKMRYVGGDSPRSRVAKDVYTSTEAPPSLALPLHNELSFLDDYPRRLWFSCEIPPRTGGATVLADGRKILRDLDPKVRDHFVAEGVHYIYSLRGRSLFFDLLNRFKKVTRTWMETFETTDWNVADACAGRLASRHRWLPSGRVVLDLYRPATVEHPVTGERAWFNQAHIFHFNARALGRMNHLLASALFWRPDTRSHEACFGDETELDNQTIGHVFDVMDRHTVSVNWRRGDVLWIDNLVCMHGRSPFHGPRRVLVAMTR